MSLAQQLEILIVLVSEFNGKVDGSRRGQLFFGFSCCSYVRQALQVTVQLSVLRVLHGVNWGENNSYRRYTEELTVALNSEQEGVTVTGDIQKN